MIQGSKSNTRLELFVNIECNLCLVRSLAMTWTVSALPLVARDPAGSALDLTWHWGSGYSCRSATVSKCNPAKGRHVAASRLVAPPLAVEGSLSAFLSAKRTMPIISASSSTSPAAVDYDCEVQAPLAHCSSLIHQSQAPEFCLELQATAHYVARKR
jgi:hypothetical protein